MSEAAEGFGLADLGDGAEPDIEQGGDDGAPVMTEEAARKAGWVPKDEWNGAPERWSDWQPFLERGDNDVTILRANNRRMSQKLRNMEKKLARTQADIEATRGYVTQSEQRGYQRAMEAIKAKQRDAVEQGDTAAFDAADREIDKLQKDMREAEKPAPTTKVSESQFKEEFAEWAMDNPWYGENATVRSWLEVQAGKYKFDPAGDETPTEYFERLADMAKKRNPAMFEKAAADTPARRASAVEGVTRGRPKPAGFTAADLNEDAKRLGGSMVRMGLFKDLNEYAKSLAPDA